MHATGEILHKIYKIVRTNHKILFGREMRKSVGMYFEHFGQNAAQIFGRGTSVANG